jgi:hypothetical protein
VIELGKEPEQFWRLGFYEWTLWANRIRIISERRHQDKELSIELERNTMALIANVNRGKNTPAYHGKDFYKLSYDEVTEEVKTTGESMFNTLTERFKNIPIRKGNRG